MELVKNKASGKHFIIINDNENGTGLMVTPQGEVKVLELQLFDHVEVIDPECALVNRRLTVEQIDKYKEYLDTLLSRG
ncbi:MAG: hypothetical protein KKH85_11055 [Proteobacteria bacterium]|nr:hypothetical protein [Pseudomonadota bacterium]